MITPHFSYDEMTRSSKAKELKLDNEPSPLEMSRLTTVCWQILEPARETLGASISVSSGFRSVELNKALRGANTSQHTKGEAVDIVCYDNLKLFKILYAMEFDQLILEKPDSNGYPSWVHVSYVPYRHNRQETLVYDNGKYYKFKSWVSMMELNNTFF